MKKFLTMVSPYASLILILFIVLFDVDGGVAMGAQMWTNTPASMLATAEIFGNLLWMVAIIAWIVGIALLVISLMDEVVDKSIKDAHKEGKLAALGEISFTSKLLTYTNLTVGILATGSGFWFSGTGLVVMILGVVVWRKVVIKARDEKLDELKGDDGPTTARDLLKKHTNDLLDQLDEK